MNSRIAYLCLLPVCVFADIAVTPESRQNIRIVAYEDCGLVSETRKINVPQGTNKIRFEGVASQLVDESVQADWAALAEFKVYEQSYEFDLISPQKLLEKFVGKELEIVPESQMWSDSVLRHAELISVHDGEPVFRVGPQITFGNVGRVLFPYVPENLFTKPTLIWLVNSVKRQNVTVTVTYLAEGISWRSDYVVVLDKGDDTGLLTGRMNCQNHTGMDFNDALFTFVSGPVRRSGASGPQSPTGQESSILPVDRPVSLQNGQKKTLEWLAAKRIRLRQTFLAEDPGDHALQEAAGQTVPVCAAVEFHNTEAAGLGIPLPRGTVRVYKKENSADQRFLGERAMPDMPEAATVVVPTGYAGGISAEFRITGIKRKNGLPSEVTKTVSVTNGRNADVAVRVRSAVADDGRLLSSSDKAAESGGMAEWLVTVRAKQKHEITFTVLETDKKLR